MANFRPVSLSAARAGRAGPVARPGAVYDTALPKDPAFVNTWSQPQQAAPIKAQPGIRQPRPYREIAAGAPPTIRAPQQPAYDTNLQPDPQFQNTWGTQPQDQYRPPVVAPPPDAMVAAQAQPDVATPEEVQQNPLGANTFQSFKQFSKMFQQPNATPYDPSQYQNAYDASLKAATSSSDAATKQAQQDRDYQLSQANQSFADEQKQINDSYNPKLQETKQFLSDRGILDSSTSGEKLAGLLTDNQKMVQNAQKDLDAKVKNINDTYTNRTASIQANTQQEMAKQQDLLSQRLENLQNNNRIADENKQKFQYQIYQDYQQQVRQLEQDQRQQLQDEQRMANDAFQQEVSLANVTGMYQGQPTYKSQLDSQNFDYKTEQDALKNELAQAKFELAAMKKGGGGGSKNALSNTVQNLYEGFKSDTAGKVHPKIAEQRALAKAISARDKAALKTLIDQGPAQFEAPLGPLPPGAPAFTPTDMTWADVLNPKTKSTQGNDALDTLIANGLRKVAGNG